MACHMCDVHVKLTGNTKILVFPEVEVSFHFCRWLMSALLTKQALIDSLRQRTLASIRQVYISADMWFCQAPWWLRLLNAAAHAA